MGPLHRIAFCLLTTGALSFAQQILTLNDGTRIAGRYDGGDADTVRFIDEHASQHKFNIHEVQSIVFTGGGDQTADRLAPGSSFGSQGYQDTDETPTAGWTRASAIPAGAELVVRTIDPIEVRRPDPHRQYLATVENDVRDDNGRVVIPRGAEAHLIVHSVGGGEIAVDLRSVSVNGRRLILNSQNVVGPYPRNGKRTAILGGGGALLGTVLGAIAGGGKGAAIGALAGGGTGIGTAVLTRGQALNIPSETILRFRLNRPVYLYD